MELAEALQLLKDAQHDPAKLALATVDLVHSELLESDRVALKATLEVAAIPHWCDATIVAALIDIPEPEGTVRLARLRELTVVEPFPARGGNSINVHEAARLALRNRIASEDDVRFRGLAARATACFAEDHTPAGRIEWVYHLLCSEPESGADELQKLDRNWSGSAPPEDREALSAALNELEDNRLIDGRARLWVLLVTAWNRVGHGESAQLAKIAETTLSLAKSLGDTSAEGEAQALLGVVLQKKGNLSEAKTAFEQSLATFQRLTKRDPSNSGWQRELGVAYSRVGDVHKDVPGKL